VVVLEKLVGKGVVELKTYASTLNTVKLLKISDVSNTKFSIFTVDILQFTTLNLVDGILNISKISTSTDLQHLFSTNPKVSTSLAEFFGTKTYLLTTS
jgi:hypothetical protein